MFGYTILLFSLPSYGRAIGLSANQGSILGAVLNAGQMIGRPLIGLTSDRWGRLNLATVLTFLCGIFCFAFWIPAETVSAPMGLLCFFAIVGGAVAGTFWTVIAPVGAEIIGIRDLPAGLSWTWVLMVPPTTFAEPIALELRRRNVETWIYLPPQLFTAFMYIGGGLCIWLARAWKVGEMEARAQKMAERGRRQESILNAEKRSVAGQTGWGENERGPGDHEQPARPQYQIWALQNMFSNMFVRKVV